jgi:CheY-like chemotaxis protein
MSLAGNLGDLGFGEILQIVSLSRKSGVFLVHQGAQKAKIIFRDGQILAAFTNFERQDLCQRLLEQGEVSAELLDTARRRFRSRGGGASIADCLLEAGAPRDRLEAVSRAEIEGVVLRIFAWEEGDFSFELKEIGDDLSRARANPYRLVLQEGINPQFLAMEGTRLADEARRGSSRPQEGPAPKHAHAGAEGGEATEDGLAEAPAVVSEAEEGPTSVAQPGEEEIAIREPEGPTSASIADEVSEGPSLEPLPGSEEPAEVGPTAGRAPVILVDDEERFLDLVREALEARGYSVETFQEGGVAAERIDALVEEGGVLGVVSDLIMPRADGEGLLGGIELLERVRKRHRKLPFVLVSDHRHEEAEARARRLDVDFTLAKPHLSGLTGAQENTALKEFLSVLDPILASFKQPYPRDRAPEAPDASEGEAAARADPQVPEAERMIDLRRALLSELGDPDQDLSPDLPDVSGAEKGSREILILRSMLCELSNPTAGGQITLLILRFAAELLNRAVLFMASESEVVGLGQFGVDLGARCPDRHIREIRIPLDQPSVFYDVVRKRSVLCGPLDSSPLNAHLIEHLGGEDPGECFVAPIIANEKVIAVLYGDNLPSRGSIAHTEALEIFLTQAGLAFEKAILERRIKEMSEVA